MAEKEISHKGIVRETGSGKALVEILSQSACSSCHAAGLCSASEAVKKMVEVTTFTPCQVGQEVEVVLKRSMGMKAVLLAYVVPLFILLILVVSLSYTNVHELVAGAVGIAGVALWYLVLLLFKNKLRGEYVFYIKENNTK